MKKIRRHIALFLLIVVSGPEATRTLHNLFYHQAYVYDQTDEPAIAAPAPVCPFGFLHYLPFYFLLATPEIIRLFIISEVVSEKTADAPTKKFRLQYRLRGPPDFFFAWRKLIQSYPIFR